MAPQQPVPNLGDAEIAQALSELARGEQTASAMESQLSALEQKIDALLASAETHNNAQADGPNEAQTTDNSKTREKWSLQQAYKIIRLYGYLTDTVRRKHQTQSRRRSSGSFMENIFISYQRKRRTSHRGNSRWLVRVLVNKDSDHHKIKYGLKRSILQQSKGYIHPYAPKTLGKFFHFIYYWTYLYIITDKIILPFLHIQST